MATSLTSAAALSVRPVSRLNGGNGRIAFGALLVFVLLVFCCPGTLFPVIAPYVPAKGVALLALAALGGSWAFYSRRLHTGGAVGAGLLLFLALAWASALWSISPEASLEAAGDLTKFVLIYFVVLNTVDSPDRLRSLLGVLCAGAVVPAVGAIYNYATGQNLVEGTRAAWVSIFANPNELAYYGVTTAPLALALRERTRSPVGRLALLGVVGVVGTAVLLSASRGGILAFAAVLLIWWVRGLRRGRLALGGGLALAAALTFVPVGVWQRTRTVLTYQEDTAAMNRIYTLEAGLKMASDKPWGGIGAGTFALAFPLYAPLAAEGAIAAHNSFIQVLGEEGIFGLGAFLLALGGAFAALARTRMLEHPLPGANAMATGLAAALLGFVLCSLTGGFALSWPAYWILGMAAALPRVFAQEGSLDTPCAESTAQQA